jgi:hypothetical protein
MPYNIFTEICYYCTFYKVIYNYSILFCKLHKNKQLWHLVKVVNVYVN